MSWSTLFPAPIVLKDGRAIATLAQARALMLNLPFRNQNRLHWQFADELLLDAAERHGKVDDAHQQVTRALMADGLL